MLQSLCQRTLLQANRTPDTGPPEAFQICLSITGPKGSVTLPQCSFQKTDVLSPFNKSKPKIFGFDLIEVRYFLFYQKSSF